MKANPHDPNSGGAPGFALMATMVMMSLVIVLTLGLLALAAGAGKAAQSSRSLAQAQSNAKLALSTALGQLQKEAGDDRRITASAGIFDTNPDTPDPDGVAGPNLVGVWNSWNLDPTAKSSDRNYKAHKKSDFRRWLVSGLTEQEATNRDSATGQDPFRGKERGILLVGPGATGAEETNSKQHVWAGRVDLTQEGQLSPGGRAAYAVLDEGAKARINFAPSTTETKAGFSSAPAGAARRSAFEKADDPAKGGSLKPYAASRDQHAKIPNIESAPFAADRSAPTLRGYSHDFTTWSRGVLSDTARGGLRKDICLFAESSKIPTDFAKRRLYSDTDTPLATQSGTFSYLPGSTDPFWSLVYDELTTARKLKAQDGFKVPSLHLPFSNTSALPDGFSPGTGTGVDFKMNRGTQAALPKAPVIVRCDMIFSLFLKHTHSNWVTSVPNAFGGDTTNYNYMLHLVYTPVITLWNPYNVPLSMTGGQIEIEHPPIGFNFYRKSVQAGPTGWVMDRVVPLDEMYVSAGQKYNKRFVMNLYGSASGGTPSGPVVMQPGEVQVFSPYIDPTWAFGSLFDWQNNLTYAINAAPGWRGPQYGYNIDWITGLTNYVIAGMNGTTAKLGVMGGRIDDEWDVEFAPKLQRATKAAQQSSRYAVSLRVLPTSGATDPALTTVSRLEFDYGANEATLVKALTPTSKNIPEENRVTFNPTTKMSDYQPLMKGNECYVPLDLPLKSWNVRPFLVLSAQAKTGMDSSFPNRPFIHGNATHPLAYIDLNPSSENQAWQSHELAFLKYESGMATDPKVDLNNRGYYMSGSYAFNGSQFGTHRELPLAPPQSLAQLGHLNLAGSGYQPNVDHPVGSSFAHPLLPSGEVNSPKAGSPSYQLLDHSWLANWRLWDGWYCSSLGSYDSPVFSKTRSLADVTKGFFRGTDPILTPRFSPWFGAGGSADTAIDAVLGGNSAQDDAFRRVAAFEMLEGAFNVNSTSKDAWKALLAGLDGETLGLIKISTADPKAVSYVQNGLPDVSTYLGRLRLANGMPTGRSPVGEPRWSLWQSGVEMSDADLDALAAGIVREVKRRGPFLSLAEFINRQIGNSTGDLSLKGALQAAIDDAPGRGNLNRKGSSPQVQFVNDYSRLLDSADVSGAGYATPEAAMGSTADGAAGNLDQLALLTQIGTYLTARSDTFRIRCYGETIDKAGKLVSRAYGEAVVQRVPDYLLPDPKAGGNEAYEPPVTDSGSPGKLSPVNAKFGRRFQVVSFRWLAPEEI